MRKSTLLFFIFHLSFFSVAFAHPGRLDEKGCHKVHEDYEYKSDKILKAGSYHCHRGLGGMRLDGLEMLESPDDPGEPRKEKPRRREGMEER